MPNRALPLATLCLLVGACGDDGAPAGQAAFGPSPSSTASAPDSGTDANSAVPDFTSTPDSGTATAIATFHSVGIVWRPDVDPTDGERPSVRYRAVGTSVWLDGDALLFGHAEPDATTHTRAPEFRGSLLELAPGTSYEIVLTRGPVVKVLTAKTWSETFPVLRTQRIGSRTTPLVITDGGSPDGYVVYEAEPGAVIDVGNASDNCVTVQASNVIVRGFQLRGARKAAVEIVDPNVGDARPLSDVVIENNDISGWGRAQSDGFGLDYDAAVGAYQQGSVERLVVQRNVIHAPRYDANSWYERRSYLRNGAPACPSQYSSPGVVDPAWQCHPEGPQAVAVFESAGNLVIRYNRIFSGNGNRYNDVLGAGSNFSFRGFPGHDSDIYGNDLADCWDDGIEAEGGGQNVRIWGNRIDRTYVGVAAATVSLGPMYVFRNVKGDARVSDVDPTGAPLADDSSKMMFAPFLKTAPRRYSPSRNELVDEYAAQADAEDASGPIRVFHNTVWQPISPTVPGYAIGSGQAISAHQALVRNVWARNNVFELRRSSASLAAPLSPSGGLLLPADPRNDFDYDLSNVTSVPRPAPGSPQPIYEAHGILKTVPAFVANAKPGELYLGAGAPGRDDGQLLPGLNDRFAGSGPDRGAFEAAGAPLEFGETAYLP